MDDEAHTIGGTALNVNVAVDGLGGTDAIYGIENAWGGSSNDILLGSSVANYLKGNGGHDTLWGAEGNDTLVGDAGDDVFFLDQADISVDGGSGRDTLYTRYVNTDLTTSTVVFKDLEVVNLDAAESYAGNEINVGNTLVLNAATVYNMTTTSGSTNTLIVHGALGDSVFFKDGGWAEAANTLLDGAIRCRKFSKSYSTGGNTYTIEVVVDEKVNTDVVRGVVATTETLTGTSQKTTSSNTDVTTSSMVDFSDRINAVRVNLSADIYNGIASNKVVSSFVSGNAYVSDVDTLSGIEWVKTGSGDDWLIGSSAANRLEGGLGNDWLQGGVGNDTLVGGLGTDTADYSDADAAMVITLNAEAQGTATTAGSNGSDVLYSIENILGSSYNDSISAVGSGTQANYIDGGAGNDTLLAGAGNDTLVYDAADGTIDGGTGTDTLVVRDASLDLFAVANGGNIKDFEVLELRGTQSTNLTLSANGAIAASTEVNTLTVYADEQDVIDLVGTWTANATFNTVGGNTLMHNWTGTGTDGTTTVSLAVSAEANVRLVGTSGQNTITGSAYADQLLGLGDNDSLNGAAGDDTLIGGSGNDILTGGDGYDTADYSTATGPVIVNLSASSVTGTLGGNSVTVAVGTAQGDGTDTLATIERVVGSAAADTLIGGIAADVFEGGAGNDSINGGAEADRLYGQSGNDVLSGGDGADLLEGGEGNDRLDGEAGMDALFGQAGDDILVFDAIDGFVDGGDGTDTLYISAESVNFVQGGVPVVRNIEVFDLTDATTGVAQNTQLTLDLSTVRQMSGSSNQLSILADAGDTVTLADKAQWTLVSNTGGVREYTQDGVKLKVQNATVDDITLYGSGTTTIGTDGNNTVNGTTVGGSGQNDTLAPMGGADTVNGGAGNDRLILSPQFRVDTIGLSGGAFDMQNNSYLVAVGDVNNDGFMDFAMRDADINVTTTKYVYRRDYYSSNGSSTWWSSASASLENANF